MSPIETLRGFVNAWECDENDHLNVQFYFGFFEDAAQQFLAIAEGASDHDAKPVTRHVRYHSELRNGQLVRADSHAARANVAGSWHLVHRLTEPATGLLAATALDTFAGTSPVPHVVEVMSDARPRSLSSVPADVAGLAARAALITYRGHLAAEEIAADGQPRHREIVARFSNAAPHFWEAMGAAQPWLAEHQLGRVALEMKVTPADTATAGPIELRSGPLAIARKTVSFFHVMKASGSGRVIAVGEVTALLFDQRRRRAIELPEHIRAKVESALATAA